MSVISESEAGLVNKYEGEDRVVAAACYLYFICAAVLLLRGDNSEFVKLNAKQAFVLLLLAILALLFAPGMIWKVALNLIILLINIYGAVQAWLGNRWTIPYLSDIANAIDV